MRPPPVGERRAGRVAVDPRREQHDFGRLVDPEGDRVELQEPAGED